jgi:hypothetical protein
LTGALTKWGYQFAQRLTKLFEFSSQPNSIYIKNSLIYVTVT